MKLPIMRISIDIVINSNMIYIEFHVISKIKYALKNNI